MNNEIVKQKTYGVSKKMIIIVIAGIILVLGTGLAVHNNDTTAKNHAMMISDAMQKVEVNKAATAAAMKQAEADKMAAHDAMKQQSTSTTVPATITAQ